MATGLEDVKSTGSLAAADAKVRIAMPGVGSVAFQVTGTFVATLTFEASVNGVDFVAVAAANMATAAKATTTTTTGIYVVHAPSARYIQARVSAYTSGTAVVYGNASVAESVVGSLGTAGGTAVDTELPAAQAMGDNLTAADSPTIGALSYGWDGANWDRTVTHPGAADAKGTTNTGLVVQAYPYNFNGTTWDRQRGDTTNGLDVDVTRLPSLPTGANVIGAVNLNTTLSELNDSVSGHVGSYSKVVDLTITRPANVTAYAAGDEIVDTSGSSATKTLSAVARVNNGTGFITGASLIYSTVPSAVPAFDVFIFDTLPTSAGDNAAFAPSDADLQNCLGVIEFTSAKQMGALSSAGNLFYDSGPKQIEFAALGGTQNLYVLLVTRTAYTPQANSEVIKLRVRIAQN